MSIMLFADVAETSALSGSASMSYKILLLFALFAPIMLVAAGRWTHVADRNKLQARARASWQLPGTRSNRPPCDAEQPGNPNFKPTPVTPFVEA